MLKIKDSSKHLSDFYSDSKKIEIRYFNKNKEIYLTSDISQTEVILKNTTSSLNFGCELRLKIGNLKFIIDDTFEWSLHEIKDLFIFIKKSKNEQLTERDKFNLSRIDHKLNKTFS